MLQIGDRNTRESDTQDKRYSFVVQVRICAKTKQGAKKGLRSAVPQGAETHDPVKTTWDQREACVAVGLRHAGASIHTRSLKTNVGHGGHPSLYLSR